MPPFLKHATHWGPCSSRRIHICTIAALRVPWGWATWLARAGVSGGMGKVVGDGNIRGINVNYMQAGI